jgi:hypothetical protein
MTTNFTSEGQKTPNIDRVASQLLFQEVFVPIGIEQEKANWKEVVKRLNLSAPTKTSDK